MHVAIRQHPDTSACIRRLPRVVRIEISQRSIGFTVVRIAMKERQEI
jgi:hypothetical protein